ncbi:MAG: hypothetical protein EKK65_12270 [Lysobacterales bacterium]|nr:MAG: hypothetical protein EKK65_12270 [Xanthomonadales bacterium]
MTSGNTVFELRVHGVSGTSPQAMLSCPEEFVERVCGNDDAAFYRRAGWVDRAANPRVGTWWRRMEAYSWGGLTSRKATRALWLLFLPFSLINLAHWMLPPVSRPGPATVVVVLLRLLALSFTLTLLLSMAVAVLDIAVWQCAGTPACSSGWGPLALLGSWPVGVRLLVGARPLVAVIGALWWLGREETTREPEAAAPVPAVAVLDAEAKALLDNTPPPPGPVVTPTMRSPLARTTFWNGDDAVQCMRACHVTAWAAGLGALVLAPVVNDEHTGVAGLINAILLGVNGLTLLAAVSATVSSNATGRGGRPASTRMYTGLMRMRWFALAMLGISLIWTAAHYRRSGASGPSSLPGLHDSIYALVVAQVVLLVAAFVGILLSKPELATEEGYRPTLRGYTTGFVALLGWLLGGTFSAGVGLWTAQTLGTWTYPGDTDRKSDALLIVPPAYVWAAVAALIVVIVALAAVIRLAVQVFGEAAREKIERIAEQGEFENNAPDEVRRKILGARRLATLTDRAPSLVGSLVSIASALFLVAAALLFVFSVKRVDEVVRDDIGGIAVGATVGLVLAVIGLVAAAFRNRQTRRVVAILWDVITFWPRANHPLTPPSYGGRTVFDLRLRMRDLVASPRTRVVLVAHSQGTIIAAATLMQCSGADEQFPLLTFGSPLRRLYARNFPAYFGRKSLEALRLIHCPDTAEPVKHRWINLWSLTDPIGSWVFVTRPAFVRGGDAPTAMGDVPHVVDCRVFDVQQRFPRVGEFDVDRDGAVCGHSGFWTRAEYAEAVAVLQQLVAPEPEGVPVNETPPPTQKAL